MIFLGKKKRDVFMQTKSSLGHLIELGFMLAWCFCQIIVCATGWHEPAVPSYVPAGRGPWPWGGSQLLCPASR